ncbi:MAG: tryptophan--tRNA ligase [Candidatus Stygibacter australis]|nr:tryptophan--tRNA ligase [Candidatus Stygibacter australis]
MNKKIALTGIKPTGNPHIGNYFGAIKPALQLSAQYETRYFIADYHALNQTKDPDVLSERIYEIAAAWLACGLDPEHNLIYKQSAVPQTFELSTILLAFTPKGLMNRAHAYKAMVQTNNELNKDTDDGVNMGLFTYPVLMSADILLFDADVVPVGSDQQQHLEMATDIAEVINRNYKKEILKVPQALIHKDTGIIVGLDGRKMSKSYNNTIPMFLPEKKLRKLIMKIVTNSQTIEEPKDPDICNVFALYKLFADQQLQEDMKKRYRAGGLGWGHAKQALFEIINETISSFREKYNRLMADKGYIDDILEKGSAQARELAEQKLVLLRKEIGVR